MSLEHSFKQIMPPQSIAKCYMGILLSYVPKVLRYGDSFNACTWSPDLYWDASHGIAPLIKHEKHISLVFCFYFYTYSETFLIRTSYIYNTYIIRIDRKPIYLKTTHSRLCLAWGILPLPIFLLALGSEKYDYTLAHVSTWITYMIQNVKLENVDIDSNGFLKDFYVTLNFDRGSQANAEHVLFNLVYEIKKRLKIPHNQRIFINEFGVKFDWCKFYIHVCLFIYIYMYILPLL